MEAGSSSPLGLENTKKSIGSPAVSVEKKASYDSASDVNLMSVKTPGKTADPPRRITRSRAALSVKDIKKEALRLQDKVFSPPAKSRLDFGFVEDPVVRKKKKSAASGAPIPEKYELLEKFFNSLESSVRLLKLKRYPTSFTNISSQIEKLTDRRFTYSHLAQLMFLMPKVIMVEKILQLDECTSCMKPELRILFNPKAIDTEKVSDSESIYLQLRKVFHDRILEFINSHPEEDEVPQEELPEPFCWSQESVEENPVKSNAATSPLSQASIWLTEQPTRASHLPSSFKRRFSLRGSINGREDIMCRSSDISHTISGPSVIEKSSSSNDETPVKTLKSKNYEEQSTLGTPVESVSISTKFMSSTPAKQPPKRSCMSPDDDSFLSPGKLTKRPPPNRLLRFDTPVKSKEVEDNSCANRHNSSDDDILAILPDSLLQSIREKERLTLIAQDPDISRAKRRCQMIANLPKLFDMIHFLFQSIRKSVITKDELLQNISSTSLDILDKEDLEEQLGLLHDLASDWIYEKKASNGDILVCINKNISSPQSIRTRLSEAK